MADYMVWRDEYSLRFDEIDRQHRKIIGIINEMFQLAKDGGSDEKFEKILSDLKAYTETHFAYEENIMRLAEFPAIKEHEKLHRAMAEKTAGLLSRKLLDDDWNPAKALDFLKQWWLGHIRGKDVEYVPYVEPLNMEIDKASHHD
jgi:hemerythrin